MVRSGTIDVGCFPDARALIRLQADHVNRALVPAFYRYLQAQDEGQSQSRPHRLIILTLVNLILW